MNNVKETFTFSDFDSSKVNKHVCPGFDSTHEQISAGLLHREETNVC